MPKVFEQDGFSFFFYINEHDPIHVHVSNGGKIAKFEVSVDGAALVANSGMKKADLKKAEKIASERKAEIVAKWNETFGKEN